MGWVKSILTFGKGGKEGKERNKNINCVWKGEDCLY